MSDNPLRYGRTTADNPLSTQWAPSAWKPGQPPTGEDVDLSSRPMPTAEQIEAQRQAIYARLRKYGHPIPRDGLSDQQVISTMTNLPQPAVQWPDWVQEYAKRHPEEFNVGGRLGVDTPFNDTYSDWNLRSRALGGLTTVGSSYAIPQGALVEKYGQAAVDQMHRQWVMDNTTPWQSALHSDFPVSRRRPGDAT